MQRWIKQQWITSRAAGVEPLPLEAYEGKCPTPPSIHRMCAQTAEMILVQYAKTGNRCLQVFGVYSAYQNPACLPSGCLIQFYGRVSYNCARLFIWLKGEKDELNICEGNTHCSCVSLAPETCR